MAIRIVRADDPLTVEQLVVCIYGAPGLGKSTLGFSAHNPILLDFDRGAYRAANRGDSVQVESWQDVANVTAEDLDGFDTVVVDTAGRALDFLSADIIKRNPKMGRAGALTLQGYGQLKAEFVAWVKHIRTLGKDMVLIAHSSEDKSGDDIIERIDMQGASKGEIYKTADAMGRLSMVNGQRILNFSPTDTAFGKNPGNLPAMPVPEIGSDPVFMGGLIDGIKEKLNALTGEQKARQSEIADWLELIAQAKDADAVNELLPKVKDVRAEIAKTIKGKLHKSATESLGLTFDKSEGKYVLQKEAA